MAGNNKARGFFGEFQAFIARGNVLDLAVGVIIGGAFSAITTSLVNDIINPILGIFTGGGALMLGNFINSVLNFLIMAFVVFCIVKGFNALRDRAEALKRAEASSAAPVPEATPAPSNEEVLLGEIRDLLKARTEHE